MYLLSHCLALCSSLAECHFQVFGVEPNTKIRPLVQPRLRHGGDIEKPVQSLSLKLLLAPLFLELSNLPTNLKEDDTGKIEMQSQKATMYHSKVSLEFRYLCQHLKLIFISLEMHGIRVILFWDLIQISSKCDQRHDTAKINL